MVYINIFNIKLPDEKDQNYAPSFQPVSSGAKHQSCTVCVRYTNSPTLYEKYIPVSMSSLLVEPYAALLQHCHARRELDASLRVRVLFLTVLRSRYQRAAHNFKPIMRRKYRKGSQLGRPFS